MEKIKDSQISISSGTIIRFLVILIITFLLYLMLDLILVVLTAIVIASAIEPIAKYAAKYKIKRVFAVLITYICLVLIFIGLMYFFVPPILNEVSSLLNNAPQYLKSLTLWNPLQVNENLPATLAAGQNLLGDISAGSFQPSVFGDLISDFQNLTLDISGNLINIFSSIFGGVFSFILIIVLSFYLSVQEGGVEKFLKIVTPAKNEAYIINLWKRTQKKIGYWMQGQLLLGVLVGILVYLGLMILGVKNALLLAVLAGILEIIPLFGPILAAIPAILFGFMDGGLTTGLLVLGLFIIIQQFENHLIYPLVVKKVVGISPIVVILALIIGAKLAGFLGILLSVPVTAALMEFFDDVQKDKQAVSDDLIAHPL